MGTATEANRKKYKYLVSVLKDDIQWKAKIRSRFSITKDAFPNQSKVYRNRKNQKQRKEYEIVI